MYRGSQRSFPSLIMLQDMRYHKYIVRCVVSLLGYGSRIVAVGYLLESSSEQIGVPRDGATRSQHFFVPLYLLGPGLQVECMLLQQ